MSLKRYYINAQSLSLTEREALFTKIDRLSFITSVDVKNIGCFEVFWDSHEDIKKVVAFPPGCTITPL